MDSSPNRSTAEEVILSLAGYFPVTVPKLSERGTGTISMNFNMSSMVLSVNVRISFQMYSLHAPRGR